MKFRKALLCTALSVGAALAASPAEAQRVGRIVAFGDSYADDGNFFELTGIPRPAAYATGRFSNGTNFVDTMALGLNVPVQNFAIGGAFTGSGNINGIPGLGFQLEYQSFLAGGGPAAFPRTTGSFAPTDLLVISIGGNDARAYRLGGGTVAGAPAAAAPRVVEATTGLTALVNAGARNITFLAGDVGRLPEAVGQPSAAAGSAFSAAFNLGMQTSLANFANQGVIVNYLDLNLIGDRVQANPAAYGLRSAGAVSPADAAAGLSDQYLFYADNVHLTSAGFAIVGRYAMRQLEAPLHLEGQAETGLQAATSFGSTLLGRLDLSAARAGGASENGLNLYASVNTASAKRQDTMQSLGFNLDTTGATLGAEYVLGTNAVLGAALNYSRGEADMVTGSGRVKSRAWQAGVYAGWSGGGAFVEGYAAYGWLDLDIRRAAVIDDLAGETDGTALTAGVQAGYLFDLGNIRLGPVIGLRYGKVELDGFTEMGDAALTLNVEEQETDSLLGTAGVELRADLDLGGTAAQPYLRAELEQELAGDSRTVRYALTAAPTIVNQWVLPDRPDDLHGRITGGVNLGLSDAISLQLNASAAIASDQGQDVSGFLALRVRM